MLPKRERVSRVEFPKKMGGLRRFFFGSVRISPGDFKIAVVVSKKTLKSSPARHRVKRKLYDAARVLKNRKPATYVIYPNKEALHVPQREIIDVLNKNF